MKDGTLTTPVLLLTYNRPDLTKEVFDVIRKVKPTELYLAADGPQAQKPGDYEKCKKTRDIIKQVDWNCRVKTLFQEVNLGCRVAIASAINWFFSNVEEGIILEDDCLPSESFFWFCRELLERYRHDERIMQISGNNFFADRKQFKESYCFSKLNGCWGWATWRRAWRHFPEGLKTFKRFKEEKQIYNYVDNKEMAEWLMSYLEDAAQPGCSIWSAQWTYTIIINNGLCITPAVNLVQNKGFGAEATHGKNESFGFYSDYAPQEMEDMIHPSFVLPDNEADNIYFEIIKKTDPRLTGKNDMILFNTLKKIMPRKTKDAIKSIINTVRSFKGN